MMFPMRGFSLKPSSAIPRVSAFHVDLGLKFRDYRLHITSIVNKYSTLETAAESACCFLKTLCTTDLYLSAACSEISERAWDRFTSTYRPVIVGYARMACRNHDLATDVADGVLANISS